MNLKYRKRVVSLLLTGALLVGSLSLAACGKKEAAQPAPAPEETTTQEEEIAPPTEEEIVQAQEEAEEANEEQADAFENDGEHSFLTGMKMDPEEVGKRPLAVMMNNIKAGCPQTGISKASIVYEAPVEGRITRLMGLFENFDQLDKIGYVRSSRDYFVYSALEYDAIYAHFGQATPYVGALLNSDAVDNISGAVSGIDHPASDTFHRSVDREAPHNVYVEVKDLMRDIDKFGYPLTYHDTHKAKFAFAKDGAKLDLDDRPSVTRMYPGGKETGKPNGFSNVSAYFEYNAEDGKYYRYQYGAPQIDEATGEQIAFDNVIFQYCHGEVRDENDYLAFGLHGDVGHRVHVFTQGKVVEGSWSRYSDNDPAYYVDDDGNPIVLNQGKTWICIVWEEYTADVVLE